MGGVIAILAALASVLGLEMNDSSMVWGGLATAVVAVVSLVLTANRTRLGAWMSTNALTAAASNRPLWLRLTVGTVLLVALIVGGLYYNGLTAGSSSTVSGVGWSGIGALVLAGLGYWQRRNIRGWFYGINHENRINDDGTSFVGVRIGWKRRNVALASVLLLLLCGVGGYAGCDAYFHPSPMTQNAATTPPTRPTVASTATSPSQPPAATTPSAPAPGTATNSGTGTLGTWDVNRPTSPSSAMTTGPVQTPLTTTALRSLEKRVQDGAAKWCQFAGLSPRNEVVVVTTATRADYEGKLNLLAAQFDRWDASAPSKELAAQAIGLWRRLDQVADHTGYLQYPAELAKLANSAHAATTSPSSSISWSDIGYGLLKAVAFVIALGLVGWGILAAKRRRNRGSPTIAAVP